MAWVLSLSMLSDVGEGLHHIRIKPSGTYDEPQVTFTIVATAELLREIYPDLSTPFQRPTNNRWSNCI